MRFGRTAVAMLAAGAILAVFAAGASAAKEPACAPPPVGINVCVTDVKPALDVPAGSKVQITVEFASGVTISEGWLYGYTSSEVLIDRHFALKAGKSRSFKVKLVVPAGTTDVTFLGNSEVEGPYGRSVASVSVTGL